MTDAASVHNHRREQRRPRNAPACSTSSTPSSVGRVSRPVRKTHTPGSTIAIFDTFEFFNGLTLDCLSFNALAARRAPFTLQISHLRCAPPNTAQLQPLPHRVFQRSAIPSRNRLSPGQFQFRQFRTSMSHDSANPFSNALQQSQRHNPILQRSPRNTKRQPSRPATGTSPPSGERTCNSSWESEGVT